MCVIIMVRFKWPLTNYNGSVLNNMTSPKNERDVLPYMLKKRTTNVKASVAVCPLRVFLFRSVGRFQVRTFGRFRVRIFFNVL